MLSKNKIKFITSLHRKKNREEERLFIAEGNKIAIDFLHSDIEIVTILALPEWFEQNYGLINNKIEQIEVTKDDISKISSLTTPQPVIFIAKQLSNSLDLKTFKSSLNLVLDDIQDPGNMGTILRIADWYGIHSIICSPGCVDIYNSKVIQASMGSISRVRFHSYDLLEFLKAQVQNDNFPLYGTFLQGTNIYEESLTSNGMIIMGNEGNGISPEIERIVSKKLYIPSFGLRPTVESLNVATATAIVCSEFRRR